jgi:hypothetical protein
LSLEFKQVIEQVQRMGRAMSHKRVDTSDRMQEILEIFYNANDLDAIHERIRLVRRPEVSGYRGAAPLFETVPHSTALPAVPQQATLIATDGSQIYPDRHDFPFYYLINIGTFIYSHGTDRRPAQYTAPRLYYNDKQVRDERKRPINRRTVDARRSLAEIRSLADYAIALREEVRPLVTLLDNRLLFFTGSEVTGGKQIERSYRAALVDLYTEGAILAGYVDDPADSRMVIRLLHLLSLDEDEINEETVKSLGRFEALTDIALFKRVLKPGQRSAVMTQNSPQNLLFKKFGENFEIAFFYVNVGYNGNPHIARLDIPMWVARDNSAINQLHALIVAQCAIQGRNPYPYALTRADELAYIGSRDKQQLNELIRLELRRNEIQPKDRSVKERTKALARAPKQEYKP